MSGIQFLSMNGGGGTAVPFHQRNTEQLTTSATNPQDTLRLARYKEHWRFFGGRHWSFQREDGEPLVTANYCRAIVNKKATWLVGKGMTIEVSESLEHVTKPVIEEVWQYNGERRFLLDMAVTGGVTGDVFVMPVWQQPTNRQLAINPYTQGKVRLRMLSPHQVFPVHDPLNQEELLSVKIITEVKDTRQQATQGGRSVVVGSIGVQQDRKYIEEIFPDRIEEGWSDAPRVVRPNDLGEIPLVHIANESFPGEYFGMSDLDDIIDVQREYNEKLTDVSDIVNYHAAPITIMIGAKAKHLERSPKGLWSGLPQGSSVQNLQLNGDLGLSHKYLETVQRIMFDLSGLPEGSLGRIQPISNTSGTALQVQFQPLIEAIDRKKPNYEAGLAKINYFILRWWQLANKVSLPVDLCEHCGGRIVELPETTRAGLKVKRRKCFMIDKQTLDFLDPDSVEVNIKRKFSYGVETRMLPYRQVKEEFLKESASHWDPAPEKDLQAQAEEDAARAQAVQEHQQGEAESTFNPESGEPAPIAPPPAELQKPPEAKPEQLAPNDMNIPAEPEEHEVTIREWDPANQKFVERSLGKIRIVPTGCEQPKHLDPYKTECKLRSTLPRDREYEANLYSSYQKNLWVSRRWAQEHLDEEINYTKVDEEIKDDIPLLLSAMGTQQTGVAQAAGPQETAGSNNGAPLPPGPGPGRGNMYAAGDNAASGGGAQ